VSRWFLFSLLVAFVRFLLRAGAPGPETFSSGLILFLCILIFSLYFDYAPAGLHGFQPVSCLPAMPSAASPGQWHRSFSFSCSETGCRCSIRFFHRRSVCQLPAQQHVCTGFLCSLLLVFAPRSARSVRPCFSLGRAIRFR
jgi:hypothetical protein